MNYSDNARKTQEMKSVEFDYALPSELIAQSPVSPRDSSRLMVVDRKTGEIAHKKFSDIGQFLHAGDLLVFNDSKVFRARLHATTNRGRNVELFLLRPISSTGVTSRWEVLLKPGRVCKIGDELYLGVTRLGGRVMSKTADGIVEIEFPNTTDAEIFSYCEKFGEVPTPPYISKKVEDVNDYQTVYARHVGSVAAPTAGFHFTERLLSELRAKGVETAFVTLHVGIGTFRPLQTDTLEEHIMHREWFTIPEVTRRAVENAKREGRRVVAVGTTTVRALESTRDTSSTDIFITPGYTFKVVDAMVTNFHLPMSTLLVLVSAFAGTDMIRRAYAEAITLKYRFFSFGDAMLIT